MPTIRLARLDAANEAALTRDPDYQGAMATGDWDLLAMTVRRVVGPQVQALSAPTPSAPHWAGYVAIDPERDVLIGSCAFKAAPTPEGVIEIAYHTYPGHEGHGYATLMASELVVIAGQSSHVQRVIAHTLPQTSASTRVLEKVGMRLVGEVIDPEDGLVWRWELAVG